MTDESQYFQFVGEEHRRQFGQYFTHPLVAQFMVDWVLESGVPSLYDPSFGMGAFLDAYLTKHPQSGFQASEIDEQIIRWAGRRYGDRICCVALEDYLLSWGKRCANIVCNPPYNRFQRFLNRHQVCDQFAKHLGIRLSGYTNTASAFLLKSLAELDGRGRLAYVMPLEFLNTGYGEVVKNRLLCGGHLSALISLKCEKEAFSEVTTSVGIILYDPAVTFSSVRFFCVERIDELPNVLSASPVNEVRSEDLQSHDKWLNWFNRNKPTVQRGRAVQLKYYGHFKRGIATGANKFFVLNRSQAQQLGLPSGECVPCISRSAQLTRPIADDQTVQALSDRGENMLLFTAGHDPSDSALAYIRWGEQLGVNRRFLTRHRTPWYKTEDRVSAPILMGVFSRGGYKVILNRSRALNLTCFHGFYPNLFGSPYVIHLFLYLLSRTGRKVLSLAVRNYGDALDKFEPNDLNGALVPAPEVFAAITNSHISKELDHVEHCGVVTDQLEEIFESMMKVHLADRGSVVGVS